MTIEAPIEIDRRLLNKLAIDLQHTLAKEACANDESCVMKWITENSKRFRDIFEKLAEMRPDFFENTEKSNALLLAEIKKQLSSENGKTA